MADKNLTRWKELVLTFLVGFAKKTDDSVMSLSAGRKAVPGLWQDF